MNTDRLSDMTLMNIRVINKQTPWSSFYGILTFVAVLTTAFLRAFSLARRIQSTPSSPIYLLLILMSSLNMHLDRRCTNILLECEAMYLGQYVLEFL